MSVNAVILDLGDEVVSHLLAPVDLDAERRMVGVTITSLPGARLALEHGVHTGAFSSPQMARLFGITTRCEVEGIEARVAAIAKAAGEPIDYIDALEQLPRITLIDGCATYSGRVLNAYARRLRFEELAAELEQVAA